MDMLTQGPFVHPQPTGPTGMQSGRGALAPFLKDRERECVESLVKCEHMCLHLAPFGMMRGEVASERPTITPLILASRTCQLTAEMIVMNSPFYHRMCALCAEVCRETAKDLDRLAANAPEDDAELAEQCAVACRQCAEKCEILI